MLKNLFLKSTAIFLFALAAVSVRADIKVTTRQSVGGQTLESTVYIKGKRERRESKIPGLNTQIATVTQCDAKRTLMINDSARKYIVTPFGENGTPANPLMNVPTTDAAADSRRGGVVTYTVNINDTGERKQMFGFTARHIKTSMRSEPSPDACDTSRTHIESDGWYIDLEYGLNCGSDAPFVPPSRAARGGCRDTVRFKQTGGGKLGYPLSITTTVYDQNDRQQTSFTQETVALSRETLDASLFDVPAGYTEAKNAQELYGFGGMTAGMMNNRPQQNANGDESGNATTPQNENANNQTSSESGGGNPISQTANKASVVPGKVGGVAGGVGAVTGLGGVFGRKKPKKEDKPATTTNTATASSETANVEPSRTPSGAIQPKKAGAVRVGVIAVGNQTDAKLSTDALRAKLISSLNSSGIDAVPVDAQSLEAVVAEARTKGCDFILYTDVTSLKQPVKKADDAGGILGRSPLGGFGGGKSKDVYDANVTFRLLAVPASGDDAVAQLESNSGGKSDTDANAVNKAIDAEAKAVAAAAKKK